MDGNSSRIRLFFIKFAVALFGMKIIEMHLDAKGVWKMVFVGNVEMEQCHRSIGSRKFFFKSHEDSKPLYPL